MVTPFVYWECLQQKTPTEEIPLALMYAKLRSFLAQALDEAPSLVSPILEKMTVIREMFLAYNPSEFTRGKANTVISYINDRGIKRITSYELVENLPYFSQCIEHMKEKICLVCDMENEKILFTCCGNVVCDDCRSQINQCPFCRTSSISSITCKFYSNEPVRVAAFTREEAIERHRLVKGLAL